MNQKFKKLLSVDIETESTTKDREDALNPFWNRITCIGVVDPVTEKGTVYRDLNLFNQEVWSNPSYAFFGQNFKWDFKTLYFKLGMPASGIDAYHDDTRLMAFVSTDKISEEWLAEYETERVRLNKELPVGISHREAKGHSLKTLAPYFLGVDAFWEDPTNHDSDEYVLKDCLYTARLRTLFYDKLRDSKQLVFYKKRMMNWARMILKAELTGFKLDVPAMLDLQKETSTKIVGYKHTIDSQWHTDFKAYEDKQLEELQQRYQGMFETALSKPAKKAKDTERLQEKYSKLYTAAADNLDKFNLDSPTQLKWLLKDRLGLDVTNFEGDESTGKEVLHKLSVDNPEVKVLLDYRESQKLATAFIPSYLGFEQGGKIHANYNMDGTRTGRLSCSAPNLQQFPRDLKHLFTASSGKLLVTYDLSAIEPMILAHYSGDPELEKVVSENKSFHSLNAISLFNLDCDESEVKDKYPRYRSIAKTIGLAVLYGAGKDRVMMAAQNEGIKLTREECRAAVKRIRDTYAGVWQFKEALDDEMKRGTTIFNLLGRPLTINDPDEVYMKSLNTLIQSSASDLCLETAYRISKIPGCTPVALIHDSVVTEVDSPEVESQIKAEFEKWQLGSAELKYNTRAEGGINFRWI